ncbi:MAG: CDP-glycerol glycerophosphotransferase family protein [Propionicimonas sp.]|uniref:CDP-glycerol glycerophosphotransferase family protein n=1 Tax=Propionicimonas sp. TaxID=1955623 RepID=UPI003D1495A9
MSSGGFRFARGNLGKLLALPRYAWGALQARSSKRNPKLWVVGSAFGPADGALAFWRAAKALPDPPRLVWLSGSAEETAKARALGLHAVVDRDSAEAHRLTLRAGLVAVTHGFGDVDRYGVSGAVIVQLWHGAPVKKLHSDSPAVTSLGGLERVPGVAALMRRAYRTGTSRISLLPTASGFFAPFLASAFHLIRGEVKVLGEPRTDVLFTGTPEERGAASRALLAPHLGEHAGSRVVLYAPTWRDGDADPGVPTELQWLRIEELCERLDLVLLVRPHQLGVGEYNHSSSRVRLLTAQDQPESMPLLWGLHVLVTDYSSMLVDFVVTGRPLLLLAPDLDAYRASRGLYVDYGWLSGGRWSTDWDDVVDRLEALFTDPAAADAASAHSRELAARFHEWTDGRSAQRVAEEASALVAREFG